MVKTLTNYGLDSVECSQELHVDETSFGESLCYIRCRVPVVAEG